MWAPNIHFNTPNADIPALHDGSLEVVCKPIPVKGGLSSINSFGFGGANAHVILRPNEKKRKPVEPRTMPRLVQVCGRSPEAVETLIQESRKHVGCSAYLSLLNEISSIPVSSMPYRGYTLVGSEGDVQEIQQVQASGRPLWYICSGKPAAAGPGFCIPLDLRLQQLTGLCTLMLSAPAQGIVLQPSDMSRRFMFLAFYLILLTLPPSDDSKVQANKNNPVPNSEDVRNVYYFVPR